MKKKHASNNSSLLIHEAPRVGFRGIKRCSGRLFFAAFCFLSLNRASGELSIGTSISSYGFQASGTWEQNYSNSLLSSLEPTTDSYTSEGGGVASAGAAFGSLNISTSRVGPHYFDPFFGGSKSTASAHWQDQVVINSPGRYGKQGYAKLTFTVSGKINVTGASAFYTEYQLLYGGDLNVPYKPDQGVSGFYQSGLPVGAPFIGIPQEYGIQFYFGVPSTYALTLVASSEVSNHDPATASVSLSNDVAKGRFRFHSVTDEFGSPVSFTTSSHLPTDETRPNITLRSLVPSLTESAQTGSFEILLDRPAPRRLSVLLKFGGTAKRGIDYKVSTALSVTIPKGATRGLVKITTINDSLAELREMVTLTLLPYADYNLATAKTSTIYIEASDL